MGLDIRKKRGANKPEVEESDAMTATEQLDWEDTVKEYKLHINLF